MHDLAGFLLASTVLILVPGPSVVFVVSRGVALGRRAAIVTVLGNAAGLAVALAFVSLGLTHLLTHSQAVLVAVTLLGGAYLIALGVRTIRDRRARSGLFETVGERPRPTADLVREGFVVGVTNPKAIVIFAALLPRFVYAGGGEVAAELLALGGIFIAIAIAADSAWALAAGSARRWFGSSQQRLERLTALGGVVLICLGVGLVVAGVTGESWGSRRPGRDHARCFVPSPHAASCRVTLGRGMG
jgi:threonine/homoserine/homoserine lactone efflux protein